MIILDFIFRVPAWLNIKQPLVPDLIAWDPELCPVWEITGAEFSIEELHTAGGISIRLPRVTRERTDKTWTTATSLQELRNLYEESKNNTIKTTTWTSPSPPRAPAPSISPPPWSRLPATPSPPPTPTPLRN